MTLDTLRHALLETRDRRAEAVHRLVREHLGPRPAATLVVLSLNMPGVEKNHPGLDPVFAHAVAALLAALSDSRLVLDARDPLGLWAVVCTAMGAEPAKRACVNLEETMRAGRLVDLDVFGGDGAQVDRRALGLPPRRCLACDRPAADCIRARRHATAEVEAAARALLS